ncbi:LysR family transcriptional regulator [Ruegeria arenilitoris]|uniref:LysR family transcriptional regulator n=1 Tax=Ruegeria arenilitoris TaxID=1173585 RepID=UPI003463AD11
MDIRQLRYFLEIVEQGSLTAASRTLNVAQPALSLHLRNMEERLDTALLVRKASGVEPTEAGEILRSRARNILNELERTEDEIRNLDKSPGGAVRLGLSATISEILTLPLIDALQEKYPRITLNIADAMSGFVTEWLEEGRVDLAVLYNTSAGGQTNADVLVEEELVLIQPPDKPIAKEVSLRCLSEAPVILPSKGHGLRDLIESAARSRKIEVNVAMEIDSYRNTKHLVAKGFGNSVLPLHAVTNEVSEGSLTYTNFARSELRRGAILKRSGTPSRAQQAVEETIQEVVADLVQSGNWAGATLSTSLT